MTDTEYEVQDELDDEEVDFDGFDDEFEDEELDFDNIAPKAGNYELEMVRLSYSKGPNKKDPTVTTYGLNLAAKMITDDDWNGTFVNKYIWLGNDAVSGNGRAELLALANACGVPCSGRMKLSEFAPVKKAVGKSQDMQWVFTKFNECRFGAYVNSQDVERQDGTKYSKLVPQSWMSLEELESARELANQEEF